MRVIFSDAYVCYGRCETCKNYKHIRYGAYTCKKDGKLKFWYNKCYLYKIKRIYAREVI